MCSIIGGEGLPGFICLGFIFSRGSIYLLRIYWILLVYQYFNPVGWTHPHSHLPLPSALSKPSPSPSGGIMCDLFQDVWGFIKKYQ
jgi:hypothetical protein